MVCPKLPVSARVGFPTAPAQHGRILFGAAAAKPETGNSQTGTGSKVPSSLFGNPKAQAALRSVWYLAMQTIQHHVNERGGTRARGRSQLAQFGQECERWQKLMSEEVSRNNGWWNFNSGLVWPQRALSSSVSLFFVPFSGGIA
ncbi:protein FAR1-RELATED SEQUENCE 5-like protein [Anopheles sinensis]|uniref:Protein FAR1-RELATED SEQUENCE 5-like protein n=1 Tax=Anopheles sinensis TaxID=74873 RepID=A0A084W3D8_ANOSI|nr:protein FAR1-RELATED SEQUENCE 5-like protein [Anopheles sinensis]